jgi:hypothetical protein
LKACADYPDSRPKRLEWLASRGLCNPETAAEYVGRKLLSHEVFAQARNEYERVTVNYAPVHYPRFLGKFTMRKPDEYPLLEIWHLGLGPNVSYGALVAAHPRAPGTELGNADKQQPLLVRYGFPASYGLESSDPHTSEGSITSAAFEALLEPLKNIQVPPYPGEEAFVCDGAIYGFELALGTTHFSYQWHTIPPKGWEPVADWLGGALELLEQLAGAPCF